MELIRNIHKGEFGLEGEVYFELFAQYFSVYAEDEVDSAYIEACAVSMNSLSEAAIEALCQAAIRYCNDFLHMVGQPKKHFENLKDILSIVQPSSLIVPYPENGTETVVHLELNCDWEIEHGMEWLVRNNEVLYVGGFNDVHEWGDYSEKESYNYA